MARFSRSPRLQLQVDQLLDTATPQPFFLGAPFGEGSLIGFRFTDFGPYGQEFAQSEWLDEDFGGFVPFTDQFAGLGRLGRFGGTNRASAKNSSSKSGSSNGSSNGSDINLAQGAYNPFNQHHLLRGSSGGSHGDGDGHHDGDWWPIVDHSPLPGPGVGIFPHGTIGFTPRLGLGPGAPGLFPFTPPLYGCWDPHGPGRLTPILGWPFGIFNPIIGPIGPFGFPFPHLHHHHHCDHHHCHCHHPPTCIPEPSQFAMLLTLLPGLGLVCRTRCARRRTNG